ncbi:hypothetical protein NQ318_019470 [Aromia moschata]|uniref:DDE-1 domain-containing protein n=1 Tax=Aromia moschata TaxID=1265417 RepID=A0AAV8Y996_9CUCU|nr:hypothetical protein NQ318_019470 [Aromia moschata]
MKEVFLPRKPEGKVLLILDGHSSHASYDVIQLANENYIIILCLPIHTTQALQPLDKSFFKPLKQYYKQEAQDWMVTNKEKRISRDSVGIFIGNARKRAAKILIHDVTIVKPGTSVKCGKSQKVAKKKEERVKRKKDDTTKADGSAKSQECKCFECEEDYYKTAATVDWIQCISCDSWLLP